MLKSYKSTVVPTFYEVSFAIDLKEKKRAKIPAMSNFTLQSSQSIILNCSCFPEQFLHRRNKDLTLPLSGEDSGSVKDRK